MYTCPLRMIAKMYQVIRLVLGIDFFYLVFGLSTNSVDHQYILRTHLILTYKHKVET